MSRIFWDTNLFIYLLEDKGELTERVVSLRQRMVERRDQLLTSALTLGEILVKPLKDGDDALAEQYEQAITASAEVLPFDAATATRFATVRRDHAVRPPDAIQLACASLARVDMFITNDQRLSRKVVPGIHFIQSLATARL